MWAGVGWGDAWWWCSVGVVIGLFGGVYGYTAYKILGTRRMKKLVCEAFTVLKGY